MSRISDPAVIGAGGWDAGRGRTRRRAVQLRGFGGAGSGGPSAAADPGTGGRGARGSVGGFRAALFADGPALDRVGEAFAGASAAGVLRDPFGASADGAAGLQPFVPLVRRAVDRRPGVSMAIENCALLAIENCALSTWCRTPRFGVEVVGLGGAMGNRVGAATIKSLARQPGYP